MSQIGLRFFALKAYPGAKRTPLSFGTGRLEEPLAQFVRWFEPLRGRLLPTKGVLSTEPDPEPQPGDSMIRVEEVRVHDSYKAVSVRAMYGRLDTFPRAYPIESVADPRTEAIDLRNTVPAQQYLTVFFLPSEGDTAIIASQTRGMSHIEGRLLHTARREAYRHQHGREEAWVPRFVTAKAVDEKRVRQAIEQAEVKALALTKHQVRDGVVTHQIAMRLIQQGTLRPQAVTQALLGWLENRDHDGVAGLVSAFDDPDAVGQLGFDDGYARLSYDGRTETVGPDDVDKFLIYPVDGDASSVESFIDQAWTQLRRVDGTFGAHL